MFLDELDEVVASGLNAAQRLLALYHGPWRGNIDRAFTECVF